MKELTPEQRAKLMMAKNWLVMAADNMQHLGWSGSYVDETTCVDGLYEIVRQLESEISSWQKNETAT